MVKALQLINSFCEEIKGHVSKIRSLVLFDSFARGDFTEDSDVDLCLTAEGLPKDIFARRPLSGLYKTSVRAFGYEPEEFLLMLQSLNPLTLDIVEEGLS